MSAWTICAYLATVALGISGTVLVRGDIESRLAVLPLVTSIVTIDALAIAQSFGNQSAFDVAALTALLSFPAGLVFARFYARWL